MVALAAAVLVPVTASPSAAQAGQGAGGVVVIANGWSPADVGAAAPLAGRLDAAVLYASRDELGQPTVDALTGLDPGRVLLMGGQAALGSAVESQVRRTLGGAAVERFSGADRIDTAARAALSAPAVPTGRPAVIANGWSPADVGAAAPLAASLGGSVLFAEQDSLGAPTINALRRLAPSRVILVGGIAALGSSLTADLARVVPGVPVERLAGADRIDTAARSAARADVGLGGPVVLAGGWEPADVGIAAPLATAIGGSVLVTERSRLGDRAVEALSGRSPSRIILVGGSDRLAAAVEGDLERLYPGTPRVNIAGASRVATAALAALFGVRFSAEQQRFADAVATIAVGEADCAAAPTLNVAGIEVVDPPADLNDPTAPLTVAEVVRIAGGCVLVDYVALDGRTVADIRGLLADHPDVFAVGEPLRGFEPTHDTGAHSGYGGNSGDHFNDGAGEQWHLPADYMERLWDGWNEANPITVAVIDSGVDASHADLAGVVVASHDTHGALTGCHTSDSWDDLSATAADAEGPGGHGTHVAGIIAAQRGNGGIAGVVPDARIVPLNIWDETDDGRTRACAGTGTPESARGRSLSAPAAVAESIMRGARVINMSFSSSWVAAPADDACGGPDSGWRRGHINADVLNRVEDLVGSLDAGCDAFRQLLEIAENLPPDDNGTPRSVAAVAAAGNCGDSCDALDKWDSSTRTWTTRSVANAKALPAAWETVISVAAVGENGMRAGFSSARGDVHVAAPGVDILSAVPAGAPTTHASWHGTSMASPFVAGVVAHMLNRYPDATPEQVRLALAESAQDRGTDGKDDEYGHGIVQPLAAIQRLGEILAGPAVEPSVTVSPLRLEIDEGSSGSYTIALDSEPSGTVRVNVDVSVSTDVRVAPSTLVFTRDNFWEPQTVTVTVPEDPSGADQPFLALHSATGGGYDGAEIANVAIIVRSGTAAPSLESLSLWGVSCDPVTSGLVLFSSCGTDTSPALATDPGFDSEQLTYTVSVAASTRFVTVDAVPADGAEIRSLSPQDADPGTPGHQVRISEPVSVPPSDRADKPGTSAAVGERFLEVVGDNWSGAVIVASSENFPDGLAAASLAGALRAPILLTPKARLDPAIASFVRDNNVREVVIMGGTAAVSESVERDLRSALGGGTVSRLWGQDRYETALRVAKRVALEAGDIGEVCGPDHGTGQRSVFIATGRGSADALAASPAAYAAKMPVLLVDPDARNLPNGVRSFIRTHDIANAVILGGTSAVPERLQRELAQLGSINQVTRVAGADRYATAAQLAHDITTHCYDQVETVTLANGRGFADALAAGPLTAELHGVMLLTEPDDVPPATLDAMTQIGKEAQLTNITLALLAIGDIAQAENAVTEANNTAGQQLHGQPALGPATAIAAGHFHSCGIRTNGTVQCWGHNSYGEARPPSGQFTAIAAGRLHSCGIRTNGTVQCWGRNSLGQADPPSGQFTAITAGTIIAGFTGLGGGHSCGIRTNGTVQCWGHNSHGQADPPSGQFTAIAAGDSHSCGIRTNGTVQCWGSNSDGRADPPTGQFTAIAAGTGHSCGIRTNGTVQCWGWNLRGQADPPTGQFTAIAAGRTHSCGIRTNGTVQCWGSNSDGRADPPTGQFTAIAAGGIVGAYGHSCGIRTNGTVQCWGSNQFGQGDPLSGQFQTEAPSRPDVDTPPLTTDLETISVPAAESPNEVQVSVTVTDPHQPTTTTTYQITIRQR